MQIIFRINKNSALGGSFHYFREILGHFATRQIARPHYDSRTNGDARFDIQVDVAGIIVDVYPKCPS